jgi:hypothetical protein
MTQLTLWGQSVPRKVPRKRRPPAGIAGAVDYGTGRLVPARVGRTAVTTPAGKAPGNVRVLVWLTGDRSHDAKVHQAVFRLRRSGFQRVTAEVSGACETLPIRGP